VGADKWLERYSGQSTAQLIALEGQYRTDSLVVAFEQAVDQKAARLGERSLTEEERVILAIEALEREVNNGGYARFFGNAPEFAPMIVGALRRIGCPEVAALTNDAIDIIGIDGPLTAGAVERVMSVGDEERDRGLSDCDGRYFRVAGDLAAPLFEFIKQNQDKIDLK
jgi:hypothetical protein